MAELTRTLRLALMFQRASIRGAMQYKVNLWVGIATGVAYQGTGFAFVWVVLQRFPSLAGWTLAQVAFLYGLRLVAHATWLVPMNALVGIEWLVREGAFDRYLLRPLNPLVQLLTTRPMRVGGLGDLLTGIGILAAAAALADVRWTPEVIGLAALAILGGALIEGGIQLAIASLSFRLLTIFQISHFVDDIFSRFGSYPLKVFGGTAEWILTWVVPVAFVAYVPASVILDQQMRLAPWAALLPPAIGIVIFVGAYRFWERQLRHYQSTGN
ncbi:MAG TPA: ABC-2 family transporter protein [Candidatus Limnocylindrales bacterium]|nr:ABC-2 family transporter protein [Candidatus Limnocylindrales bacterium]